MKRRSAFLTFAACALMAAQPVKAADQKPTATPKPDLISSLMMQRDFSNVQVVVLSNNTIGFFDRSSGALYIYDSALSKCITIKQLTALGLPAETHKP